MIIPDREHIVSVASRDVVKLRKWLEQPNGACSLDRVTFEAVEGRGILVRTKPYRYVPPAIVP